MKVHDLLEQKGDRIATIDPAASVRDAAALLKQEGIGALVVSRTGRDLAGILSERDIVRALATHPEGLLDRKVADLMTHEVKTCGAEDEVTELMAVMTRSRIRHLPVVDVEGLIGIISIGDVVKQRLGELEEETHVLRDFIVGRA
jgi:CBS domain-containing protein